MKSSLQGLVLCIAVAGLAGGALAQAPPPSPPPPDHPWQRNAGGDGDQDEHGRWHRHHHRHHPGGPGLLGNLRELDLTEAQRETIHTIMEGARDQWQKPGGTGPGENPMAALENPGDPGYAAAVQAAKQRAAERIQTMSDLQLKVYDVLTAQQKDAYSKLLADQKARWEAWQQDRQGHGPGGDHGKRPPEGGATP